MPKGVSKSGRRNRDRDVQVARPELRLRALGLFAVILVVAFALGACSDTDGEPGGTSNSPAAQAEDIQLPDNRPPRQSSVVPNMREGAMDRISENINYNDLPAADFFEEDIQAFVEEALQAAMSLETNTLDYFSPVTHTGEYNPVYHMLWAALETADIRDAFVNASRHASFRVLQVRHQTATPSTYFVDIETSTPYVEPLAQRLMADPLDGFGSERDAFFAWSGAAAAIGGMDLTGYPTTTDRITLNVTVMDGMPLIFHPVSSSYRVTSQYAFLWGGYRFVGITDGDLVYDNKLGAAREVDAAQFAEALEGGGAYAAFITDVLTFAMQGNVEQLKALSFDGERLEDDFSFGHTLEYFDRMHYDAVGAARLASLEYEMRYFVYPGQTGAGAVQVTFSVEDPELGARIHFTELDYCGFPVEGLDAGLTRAMAADMIESALGVRMYVYPR